jgi:hypothetical protein
MTDRSKSSDPRARDHLCARYSDCSLVEIKKYFIRNVFRWPAVSQL